ncbi:MAG: prenyltransferase/squalene oxidase repeat-containing protein [Pirellulaceae bacterium]
MTHFAPRLARIGRRALVAQLAFGYAGSLGGRRGWTQERDSAQTNLLTTAMRRAVEKGLMFLSNRQNEDGSFGTGSFARNVGVVGLCGMAFLAEGSRPGRGPHAPIVSRCLDFVLNQATDSGLINFPEASERGTMYGHGFATLFLAEVYGVAQRPALREKLRRSVQLIVQCQNAEGGWRYEPRRDDADISVTVCQVMALRAAKNAGIYVPADTIDRAVSYVKRCQNPDGGFSYMLSQPGESRFPRSAAAVVALHSAGIYESDEGRRGLIYMASNSPQAVSLTEQGYFLYGHYYAAQAMWHEGGEGWAAWYPPIRDWLIARQRPDGAWPDPISPEYGTAMACLILQMPNNYLPIFQR